MNKITVWCLIFQAPICTNKLSLKYFWHSVLSISFSGLETEKTENEMKCQRLWIACKITKLTLPRNLKQQKKFQFFKIAVRERWFVQRNMPRRQFHRLTLIPSAKMTRCIGIYMFKYIQMMTNYGKSHAIVDCWPFSPSYFNALAVTVILACLVSMDWFENLHSKWSRQACFVVDCEA